MLGERNVGGLEGYDLRPPVDDRPFPWHSMKVSQLGRMAGRRVEAAFLKVEWGFLFLIMTLVPEGVMYADRVATSIAPGYGLTYGEDIIVLPYRAGQESAATAFGENLRDLYAADHYGTPIDNLPLMADIAVIADVDLIAAFSAGDTGLWFIRQVGAKFATPIIVGTVGPGTPLYMVYFSSGQLVGLLNGLAGAAEYESLAKVPGKALAAMDAQSVGHGYFIILMILSNIVYFALRRAGRRA